MSCEHRCICSYQWLALHSCEYLYLSAWPFVRATFWFQGHPLFEFRLPTLKHVFFPSLYWEKGMPNPAVIATGSRSRIPPRRKRCGANPTVFSSPFRFGQFLFYGEFTVSFPFFFTTASLDVYAFSYRCKHVHVPTRFRVNAQRTSSCGVRLWLAQRGSRGDACGMSFPGYPPTT